MKKHFLSVALRCQDLVIGTQVEHLRQFRKLYGEGTALPTPVPAKPSLEMEQLQSLAETALNAACVLQCLITRSQASPADPWLTLYGEKVVFDI